MNAERISRGALEFRKVVLKETAKSETRLPGVGSATAESTNFFRAALTRRREFIADERVLKDDLSRFRKLLTR